MSSFILATILAASGTTATTYGYGEQYCGEEEPISCDLGAITASGVPFDPNLPQAAIALKQQTVMHPIIVGLRTESGPCAPIQFVDKKHARFYGSDHPFDLTPGALRAMGVLPSATWSGRVYVCEVK